MRLGSERKRTCFQPASLFATRRKMLFLAALPAAQFAFYRLPKAGRFSLTQSLRRYSVGHRCARVLLLPTLPTFHPLAVAGPTQSTIRKPNLIAGSVLNARPERFSNKFARGKGHKSSCILRFVFSASQLCKMQHRPACLRQIG